MSELNQCKGALQIWLKKVSDANELEITSMTPLSGGAIQENWRIECVFEGGLTPGAQSFALRSDAASSITSSLSRSQEFKILQTVNSAGVMVPKPLWLCDDNSVLGRSFYITQLVDGIALGPKIVKDQTLGGDREALGRQLGIELSKIHSVKPPIAELDFLQIPHNHPAANEVTSLRHHLNEINEVRPVLEWGLRWAELNCPAKPTLTLVHRDFRTGNYMIGSDGLTGILDWEFASWGDPMSDLGWFCAKCWRFSHPELEAGGITSRLAFYEGYQNNSDNKIDESAVFFWEVLAHIRWAVIALQQSHRHLSGLQRSLELALTGRLLPDLEHKILNMTAPANWIPA